MPFCGLHAPVALWRLQPAHNVHPRLPRTCVLLLCVGQGAVGWSHFTVGWAALDAGWRLRCAAQGWWQLGWEGCPAHPTGTASQHALTLPATCPSPPAPRPPGKRTHNAGEVTQYCADECGCDTSVPLTFMPGRFGISSALLQSIDLAGAFSTFTDAVSEWLCVRRPLQGGSSHPAESADCRHSRELACACLAGTCLSSAHLGPTPTHPCSRG